MVGERVAMGVSQQYANVARDGGGVTGSCLGRHGLEKFVWS